MPQFAALSQLQDVDVNVICREHKVEPISSFLDRYNFDVSEDEDPSTWYSAEDGANTFSALAKYVPKIIDGWQGIDHEQLNSELDAAHEILTEAARGNSRFHLVVVIVPPGSEHLTGQ
jgi:hypothetical protein